MAVWILETLVKLVSSAGVFLAFVILLYFIQRLAFDLAMRQFGGRSIYISAIVGTPIHEISHALFCLPFRHKIVEIALFKPDGNGTLGYVHHSYNPASLWQVIGNFFIGIAPLFGGTATIYILTDLLLPNSDYILRVVQASAVRYESVSGATSFISTLYIGLQELFSALHTAALAEPGKFWLWAYLTGAISLHLSPSPADMRGSVKGFILLILVLSGLRFFSYSMGETVFSRIDGQLVSLSVSYTICIMLASALTLMLFILSLFTKKH